jgi:DNA-directed RNA polymerase subunit RPC12/RpoP
MNSKVTIHLCCPQCGGDIGFLEETKVIRCEYCGRSLLVAGRNGIHRYVIRPKYQDRKWAESKASSHLRCQGRKTPRPVESFLFFAPFWRVQGVIYRWIFGTKTQRGDSLGGVPIKERKKSLQIRILDHTIPGYADMDLGLTFLGVRAQVLRLQEFTKDDLEKKASFLPIDVELNQVLAEAERLAGVDFGPDDLVPEVIHHRMVRKRFSVIYFPVWCVECHDLGERKTLLLDAVGGAVIHEPADGSSIMLRLMGEKTRKPFKFKEIQFLPFRCPNCGWDLPFQPFSVLHFCSTCRRLWQERRGKWSEVTHKTVLLPKGRSRDGLLWVPFWRYHTTLDSAEEQLQTMADLYRIAPPLRALDPNREAQRPIYFFIPAILLRDPKQAHNLGSRLSFLQPDLKTGVFPNGSQPLTAGASMGDTEARQLWSVVLGGMLPHNHRVARLWLEDCRATLQDPEIFYFPFAQTHLFWKELWTGLAFQRASLVGESLALNR